MDAFFYGYVKSTQNTWLELEKHCGHGKYITVMVGKLKHFVKVGRIIVNMLNILKSQL